LVEFLATVEQIENKTSALDPYREYPADIIVRNTSYVALGLVKRPRVDRYGKYGKNAVKREKNPKN